MKYLIALFLLASCTPLLKEGDCVVTEYYELVKIVKVGDNGGFLVEDGSCHLDNWSAIKGGLTKTDCFNSFDSCKDKK